MNEERKKAILLTNTLWQKHSSQPHFSMPVFVIQTMLRWQTSHRLTGKSPDAYNDFEYPNRVAPKETVLTFRKGCVSLPPYSLTIVHMQVP